MDTWTVYILSCADKKTYTGCTSDLADRLQRHEKGHIFFTKSRLPVVVVLTICFGDRHKAYNFEKYLKSGSGRAFMKNHFL